MTIIFNKRFQINVDEEPSIFRNLNHQANQSNLEFTNWEGFEELFINNCAGILITEGY